MRVENYALFGVIFLQGGKFWDTAVLNVVTLEHHTLLIMQLIEQWSACSVPTDMLTQNCGITQTQSQIQSHTCRIQMYIQLLRRALTADRAGRHRAEPNKPSRLR